MTTVKVVCYKYTPLKNGEFPLKVRICKDRKSRYISLGISVKPQHWDFKRNEPNEKCSNREIIKKMIANKICEIKSEIVKLKASDINPAKRNVLDLKNETCKNREKRNVLKKSHTRHFNAIKKQSKTGCFYSF